MFEDYSSPLSRIRKATNNPDLLGCAENALGLDFLGKNGPELVVLTDHEYELD
jgi:hypothetical protein